MKKLEWKACLACVLLAVVASGQGVSWSIDISPRNRKICKGEGISFSLENERFEVSGLKNGEYVERISVSYRWKENGGTAYTNGTGFSVTTGGKNGHGAGTYGVTVEGLAEYNIVWTDADTGVINRDGPHTVGWQALDSTNYTVVETEYNWSGWEAGITSDMALMPSQLYTFVNNKIGNKLPGMRISLDSVSITGSKKRRNCCDLGEIIEDGDKENQGNFTASFKIQGRIIEALARGYGIPLSTDDHFTISLPFTSTEIYVLFNVDVNINSNIALNGYIGKKEIMCEPQKECLFSGFTLGTNLIPQLRVEAVACVRNGINENCGGVSITLIGCSFAFTLDINYNKKCDNALHIKSELGNSSLFIQFNVWGFHLQQECELWQGIKLIDI